MTFEKINKRDKIQNSSTRKRFLYIHIWASDDEIRVQSTDPLSLQVLIRTIEMNYSDCQIDTRKDLSEDLYIVKISALELKDRHQMIAWWLFKMLCERGWEPISTGENWYKLNFIELAESPRK